MQVSVVIPTYNEAENLPILVSSLLRLPLEGFRLLIVDDNSPDGTGAIADALAFENPACISVMHRSGKLGLGTAYISGFQYVLRQGAESVCQMDADLSHPPEKIPEMVAALSNFDVVLGSRYIAGGRVDDNWPPWRKGLSSFGNFYARLILGMPVRDLTGGFRIWRRNTLLGMPLDQICSNGYSFQIELTYVASRLGYQINEIPIYFADRRWGTSKMSFSIQGEAALRVWQIRHRYRGLVPKENNKNLPNEQR